MSLPLEICINTIENYVSNFSNGISLKKKKRFPPKLYTKYHSSFNVCKNEYKYFVKESYSVRGHVFILLHLYKP